MLKRGKNLSLFIILNKKIFLSSFDPYLNCSPPSLVIQNFMKTFHNNCCCKNWEGKRKNWNLKILSTWGHLTKAFIIGFFFLLSKKHPRRKMNKNLFLKGSKFLILFFKIRLGNYLLVLLRASFLMKKRRFLGASLWELKMYKYWIFLSVTYMIITLPSSSWIFKWLKLFNGLLELCIHG